MGSDTTEISPCRPTGWLSSLLCHERLCVSKVTWSDESLGLLSSLEVREEGLWGSLWQRWKIFSGNLNGNCSGGLGRRADSSVPNAVSQFPESTGGNMVITFPNLSAN